MIKLYHPTGIIEGTVNLITSKSESNRGLIIQALCQDSFNIQNLSVAEDTIILEKLLHSNDKTLDVGHAGTVMRFLTAYLCLQKGEYILTGSDRMKQRPIKVLVDALRVLGAKITYLEKEGFPPLKIEGGNLKGDTVEIDTSVSSQYISALLLIAPQLKNGLTLQFKGEPVSKPYVDMTINLMEYFGISIHNTVNSIVVKNGKYEPKELTIEGDWSAASYWYSIVANSVQANIDILGLRKESLQGDAIITAIYKRLGVETTFIENGIRLTKKISNTKNRGSLNFDFRDCPDLAQTVAVTCASLNISATFTGLQTLRIKETDRVFALATELNKLRFNTMIDGDDLLINSLPDSIPSRMMDTIIATYKDHRMAMSFAPLALKKTILIEDENVVSKSYPNFWNDLKKVGFEIS